MTGSGGDFDHDLTHVLFKECSDRVGTVHKIIMIPPIVLALLMPTILSYTNYKKQHSEQVVGAEG
jgi:hypothetical protein